VRIAAHTIESSTTDPQKSQDSIQHVIVLLYWRTTWLHPSGVWYSDRVFKRHTDYGRLMSTVNRGQCISMWTVRCPFGVCCSFVYMHIAHLPFDGPAAQRFVRTFHACIWVHRQSVSSIASQLLILNSYESAIKIRTVIKVLEYLK